MTVTYDPDHPAYFDEADLRAEMTRVYDLCHGCRLCFNLCPAFPSLFEMVDARDGDVGALTAAEQDRVVDECYQCKLCYVKCPYVPPHEWALDFPRLMMRAHAVGKRGGVPVRERLTDQALGRTDLLGKVSVLAAPVVNRVTGRTGGAARKLMEKATGIAAERMLPPYSRQRFSTWFRRRRPAAAPGGGRQGRVSVFPTCFIEYMEPAIGRDVVRVLEHNRVECALPAGTACCGAPWLHSGEVARFRAQAARNVAVLADEVRAGREVIVTQPTCAYVVKRDYPIYAPGPDAELVAAHTFDPAEYLMALHKGEGTALDTDFPGRDAGDVPDTVTYHTACHLIAQNIGFKSRDLLKLAGIKVELVQRCSGIDGTWGYRADNYELARKVGRVLGREIAAAGNETVCGDCHLANWSILQETGTRPVHPVSLVARAYGIDEE